MTAAELRKQYGHKIGNLVESARSKGLSLNNDASVTIAAIGDIDPTTLRYLETGFQRLPEHDALERLCNILHEKLAAILRAQGQSVRDYPKE